MYRHKLGSEVRVIAQDKCSSLWFEEALLATGWASDVRIALADGRIAAIGAGVSPGSTDERHRVALPGMPNLHSHAFQRGMAGFAEHRGAADDSFWTWREIMYRFVDRITPEDLRAIATLAYAEMLEGGFTRVGEFHYLHHDRGGAAFADPAEMACAIAAAAAETGIGLTLLPVFYAHAGFGGQPPDAEQRRFVTSIDGYAGLLEASRRAVAGLPDAIVGVAPHSLRAVTPAELAEATALAGTAPIHIHVAEQEREVADCLAWSGWRPIEWLLANADVSEQWCLIHATHMTEAETRALAVSGAVAGLCPITEANLGDGLFPAAPFLAAGGRFGIGSDSNVLIDAAEEMRLLEYGQRLATGRRNVLARGGASTGAALYGGALAGGWRALGQGGEIAVGAWADLVSLAGDRPSLAGRSGDALLDAYVFAGRGMIDGVWRRGAKVVSGGCHHARDAIVGRYRAVLATLLV